MPEVVFDVLKLIGYTFIPGLELRFSIPWGIFNTSFVDSLGIVWIVLVCFLANIIVGVVTYELMYLVEVYLCRWGWFKRNIWPFLMKKREKLHPLVEKYGVWGVAMFIGVPCPGTGAYAGAVGAFLLKLDRKKFWIANIVGVLVAAVAVTLICLLVKEGVIDEDSWVKKLFING